MRVWWGFTVATVCIALLFVMLVGFMRENRTRKAKRRHRS